MEENNGKFQFQKILDLKEQHERFLKLEVARLQRALAELQEAGEHCARLREDALGKLRTARQKAETELNDQYSVYFEHLRAELRRHCEEADKVEAQKKETRDRLERVMQSRKLLEQYRDRLAQQFQRKVEKAEERVLDGYSIQKFVNHEALL